MSTNKIVGWKYFGRNAKIQSHLRYRKGTDLGNLALKSAPQKGEGIVEEGWAMAKMGRAKVHVFQHRVLRRQQDMWELLRRRN